MFTCLSTDRTEPLLEPYRRRGLVTYLYQPEDTFSQDRAAGEQRTRGEEQGHDHAADAMTSSALDVDPQLGGCAIARSVQL